MWIYRTSGWRCWYAELPFGLGTIRISTYHRPRFKHWPRLKD